LTQLTEVSRRYFQTKAGYEATLILGRYQLDQGRPLAAALTLKRVADVPTALAQYDPELSVMLAACWLHANQPNVAKQTLVALKSRLPQAKVRAIRRIVEGGALEIQAYDKVFYPGLTEEWHGTRPLVGSLSLQLPTAADAELAAWIAAGTPPIYSGFGSMPVDSPADAIAMITSVCADLGERALISTGVWDVDDVAANDRVKLVGPVNHSTVFPACRAVVHHGGAGTVAASVRSGVPTVVLWVGADQPVWASRINRLKVGVAQRFSRTSKRSLTKALRTALTPEYQKRAREAAARMTPPEQSAAATADLLEAAARRGRVASTA